MRRFTHPNSPTAGPSTKLCADARKVVANPEQYAHRPLLRRMAWMALMTERGNMIDQRRLAEMPVEVANEAIANATKTIHDTKKEYLK